MLHGRYHPVTQCKLTGGARRATATSTALHMRISGPVDPRRHHPAEPAERHAIRWRSRASTRAGPKASFGYTVPNLLIDHAMRNPPVPPGFWRGVNINQNAIYLECFIDELAHAAGQDPLEFRRKLMAKHPKHLAVLERRGRAGGLGQAGAAGRLSRPRADMGFGSYVAACAEVSVERRRRAEDPPHRRRDRSAAMRSTRSRSRRRSKARSSTACRRCSTARCTVKDGRIEQENFDTYPSRCAWTRCRRSRRSSCRRAASGAASASRRSRGGAGGAERDLRRDRQAHPHDAAEEPRPAARRERMRRRAGSPRRMRAEACLRSSQRPCRPLAEPPPAGASACSGCHPRRGAAAVPPLIGPAGATRSCAAMQDFRAGQRGRRR